MTPNSKINAAKRSLNDIFNLKTTKRRKALHVPQEKDIGYDKLKNAFQKELHELKAKLAKKNTRGKQTIPTSKRPY